MRRKESVKREKLTIDKLKKYQGCEDLSDDKAGKILKSIEIFSLILVKQILSDLNK